MKIRMFQLFGKSFASLFYKPQQLVRNNTIFKQYQKLSVVRDLNSIVHTQRCGIVNYNKADVCSTIYSSPRGHKVVGKRLVHTVGSGVGSSFLIDSWNIVTLTYGSLIAAGGITGYIRTRSVPSLLSGVLSAALLFVSWHQNSPPLALAVSTFLTFAFFLRFRKTKKMYPSGILGLLSIGASAFFGYVSYWT